MADAVKETINGHDYSFHPFLGMQGWRLQIRLAKILGPSVKEGLAALPDEDAKSLMDAEINLGAVGAAVEKLTDALAEHDPNGELVAALLSNTEREGQHLKPGVIDRVYAGNYAEMVKAIVGVIRANNFFGIADFGLGGALKSVTANSPENSTQS